MCRRVQDRSVGARPIRTPRLGASGGQGNDSPRFAVIRPDSAINVILGYTEFLLIGPHLETIPRTLGSNLEATKGSISKGSPTRRAPRIGKPL